MFAGQGEVCLARSYREALLLVAMDVLGDRADGHAAPVEADEIFDAVFRGRDELDRFAGRRIGELPELGGSGVQPTPSKCISRNT